MSIQNFRSCNFWELRYLAAMYFQGKPNCQTFPISSNYCTSTEYHTMPICRVIMSKYSVADGDLLHPVVKKSYCICNRLTATSNWIQIGRKSGRLGRGEALP